MSTYLDTRDLNKRLEELQGYRDTLQEAIAELDAHKAKERPDDDDEQDEYDEETDDLEKAVVSAESDFSTDEQTELAELETLENEISEWPHGETMIPESEFKNYAMELADDIGAIDRNATWPCNCIDWDEAADQLRQDYSEVEYQGTTYLVRS